VRAERILMTADAVGGVWTYALELAHGLSRGGAEVCLAVMGPSPTDEQRLHAKMIPGLILEEASLRLEWMANAERDVARAGEWLLDLASQHDPDLVHLNGYHHAALPWQRPVVVAAHSCVRSWWMGVHGCDAPAEWRAYGQAVARGLRAADRVVAPTAAFLATLRTLYGPVGNACVILNGRDPSRFHAGDKERFVLTAGRLWDPAKNLSALAAIARTVGCPIRVAGAADPSAERGGLDILGPLGTDAMRDAFARASVFALPARYEPFGLAALEAALSGCALILGDIPTLRELWSRSAIFVQPNEPAALEAAIRQLIDEPQLAAALGRVARRRALDFTSTAMIGRYRALYDDLLGHASQSVGVLHHTTPLAARPALS
jgi:glycogen(starch) synthase